MSMSSFASDCIVQQTCYGSYCRFRVPKLYRYAVQGKWHKIPKRCMTHPREIKFVHKYAPCDTALHRMVRPPDTAGMEVLSAQLGPQGFGEISQMRLHAMQAILDACPAVASITDCMGRTPLHLACMDLVYSAGAVEMLLTACPMTAQLQDIFGRTPLHYLVTKNKNPSGSTLEKLMKAFPRAATMQDKEGQTPLSIIEESKETTATAFETLDAARQGSTPLPKSIEIA